MWENNEFPQDRQIPAGSMREWREKQYLLFPRHPVVTEATEAMIRSRAFLVVFVLGFCISGCLENPFASLYSFSSEKNELGFGNNVNLPGIYQLYPEVYTSTKMYEMRKESR